ncbi:MAG: hypothetical protein DWP92_07555 [Armatimonadetes bacterium]|nr:MAG: hypothetical protein DWP92_07555 [Armatimonadota bacterium]
MWHQRGVALVVVAFWIALVVTACGTSNPLDNSPESAIESQTDNDIPEEYLAILDADVAAGLSNLQLVIDRVVEGKVYECMRERGFRYDPTTVAELTDLDAQREDAPLMQSAASAIHALTALQQEASSDGPDRDSLEGLDAEGREAWEAANIECLVNASQEFQNPLADANSWYFGATDEAAQRTGSDPRVIEAERALNGCSSRSGYGTLAEAAGTYSSEVESIMSDVADGVLTRVLALTLLEEVEAAESQASVELSACLEPFQDVQRRVFAENMAAIADREADRFALWAAEIEDAIDTYAELLRAAEESGKL